MGKYLNDVIKILTNRLWILKYKLQNEKNTWHSIRNVVQYIIQDTNYYVVFYR